MFSKVVNSGLVCIFILILMSPFADLLERDDGDVAANRNLLSRPSKLLHNILYNANFNLIGNNAGKYTRDKILNSNSKTEKQNYISSNNIEPNIEKIVQNIIVSVQFRENVIRAFGYLLQVPGNSSFTEEQYTSLQLIYRILREKRVYFFDLLPPLKNFLQYEIEKNPQFEMVLKIISRNLPKYLQCTAHFLVRELHHTYMNIESIISTYYPPSHIFNFLYKIDKNVLNTNVFSEQDIKRLDIQITKKTEKINNILGPVFVHIITKVVQKEIPLSQNIFACILINLPIRPLDPVLEENILYIYNLGIQSKIPQWNKFKITSPEWNPYTLTLKIIINLIEVQKKNHNVINALMYILSHLQPISILPDNTVMQKIGHNDKSIIIILLDSMVYPEFDKHTIKLRNKLVHLIEQPSFDMNLITPALNRFVYDNPCDLLLGMLTLLYKNIMDIRKYPELEEIVPLVISSIILKKNSLLFSHSFPDNLRIIDLLPWATMLGNKFENLNPVFDKTFIKNPKFRTAVSKTVSDDKQICNEPKKCLISSLGKIYITKELAELINRLNAEKESSPIVNDKVEIDNDDGKQNNIEEFNPKLIPIHPNHINPIKLNKKKKKNEKINENLDKDGKKNKFTNTLKKPIQSNVSNLKNFSLSRIQEIIETILQKVNVIKDPREINAIQPENMINILTTVLEKHKNILNDFEIKVIEKYLKILKVLFKMPSIIIHQEGKTEKELKIDLNKIVNEVINFNELPIINKMKCANILQYIKRNPNVINSSKIDLFVHKTKGKLVKYILQSIMNEDKIDPELRNHIKDIIPYIKLDGPGAEILETDENGLTNTNVE